MIPSNSVIPSLRHRVVLLLRLLILLALICEVRQASAQTAGILKTGYNPAGLPNDGSLVSAAQADGKIILGATSTFLRLKTDGTVDTGYTPPAFPRGVISLAAGPNLKTMVIARAPLSSHTYEDSYLMRLQADGSVDPLFTRVTLHAAYVTSELYEYVVAVQPDEKVIVAGDLADAGAYPYIRMVRYNADGSPDTSFHNPLPTANVAYDAAVPLANGKILVAGSTTPPYPANGRKGLIAQLNADGTVDGSYQADVGTATGAYAPTFLPDGKIVYLAELPPTPDASGSPISGGVPRRLRADGTADAGFAPQFATGASFRSLVAQSNGKLVVGGYTTNYDTPSSDGTSHNVTKSGVARVNVDGSTDASFDPGTGANDYSAVDRAYVTPDSSIIVVGGFTTFDGQTRAGIAALYGDGGLDEPFFNGEATLSNAVYYLTFANGNVFGYYSFLSDPHFLYHFDLGYEYVIEAADSQQGLYLYDFKSGGFFYTSSSFSFPYLYDFTLNAVLYYYPDPNNAGHYNTDGYRFFYRFDNGEIIVK